MRLPVTIHRAPWLLPISRPALQNGGVAVRAAAGGTGEIVAVGRFNEISRDYPGATMLDYPDSVLLPGLINAHTHLELSHLAHLSQQPAPATFSGWIANMLAERAKVEEDTASIEDAARTVLAAQQGQGVVAVADISNSGLTRTLSSAFRGRLFCFKEYLGLRASEVTASLGRLAEEAADPEALCTGHAPYSTHLDLLRVLKKRAKQRNDIFPIHVAESSAEHDMLSRGGGELRHFLEQRGFWDSSFQATGRDGHGSVSYLHQHGLLDRKTVCVHSVHVTEQEMDLLVETKAKICLCPGSNQYLAVGRAPAEKYVAKGILPALGTDSLTSNPELSLWREMRLLAEEHPGIDPAAILRMATLGGAEALGLSDVLGSLAAGKEAALLAVQITPSIKNASDLAEYLVSQGVHETLLVDGCHQGGRVEKTRERRITLRGKG